MRGLRKFVVSSKTVKAIYPVLDRGHYAAPRQCISGSMLSVIRAHWDVTDGEVNRRFKGLYTIRTVSFIPLNFTCLSLKKKVATQ